MKNAQKIESMFKKGEPTGTLEKGKLLLSKKAHTWLHCMNTYKRQKKQSQTCFARERLNLAPSIRDFQTNLRSPWALQLLFSMVLGFNLKHKYRTMVRTSNIWSKIQSDITKVIIIMHFLVGSFDSHPIIVLLVKIRIKYKYVLHYMQN